MITGMHFDISSDEMRQHLLARVNHHADRTAFYMKQKETFKDAPVADMSNDPAKQLHEMGKRHAAKAEVFAFMAAHVPNGETFRLTGSELQALEFVSESLGY